MSKIGEKPVEVPQTVQITIDGKTVVVRGTNGSLTVRLPSELEAKMENNQLTVIRKNETKRTRSLHGLYRQLIDNAVVGVEKPWEKRLEVSGTGYNVKLQGEDLLFKLGYSHPVIYKKIQGLVYKIEGNMKFIIQGIDKQLVGQAAYQIKTLKQPDAYKGKGIRYEGEKLRLKPGKKVKTAAGAAA